MRVLEPITQTISEIGSGSPLHGDVEDNCSVQPQWLSRWHDPVAMMFANDMIDHNDAREQSVRSWQLSHKWASCSNVMRLAQMNKQFIRYDAHKFKWSKHSSAMKVAQTIEKFVCDDDHTNDHKDWSQQRLCQWLISVNHDDAHERSIRSRWCLWMSKFDRDDVREQASLTATNKSFDCDVRKCTQYCIILQEKAGSRHGTYCIVAT